MLKRLANLWLVLCLILTASWAAAEAVPINPTKVTLPKAAAVMKNRLITLSPALSPEGATTTYSWSSSKKSVATVDGNGVVTGVRPGKAVITVRTANKKKASCTVTVKQISMESFTVALSDWQDNSCYAEEISASWEVAGHKMYPVVDNVMPADANRAILWKSSNPKVASVNSKGVITCKKLGMATVTATSKYGAFRVSLPVAVINNESFWTLDEAFGDLSDYEADEDETYLASAKRVYAKGGYLYADMYIVNIGSFTIRRLGKQEMYLTFNASDTDYEDYDYIGRYKATLKRKIPPNGIGLATVKIGKINASRSWLIDADAYCGGYAYSKSASLEPKAAIPGISGVSRPQLRDKLAGRKPKAAPPLRRGA